MNMKRLIYVILFLFLTIQAYTQSLQVIQDFDFQPNTTALDTYREQFGKWEKPDLDDTFPYVVIRVGLEGNAQEITAAKRILTLYLGTQTMIEAIYRDLPNELVFLVPSRVRHVEITCGEGCTRQTIMDMAQLKSNTIYYGRVHYIPMEGFSQDAPITKRQHFSFHVMPKEASVRVLVDGNWQHLPVQNGVASKTLDYGTYRYEISAEDYQQQVGNITVSNEAKSIEIVLKPNFGWLTLNALENSNDAFVYVTNKETAATKQLGQLPLENAKLACGTYQVEVQKVKYKGYKTTITIREGGTITLTPKLQPNYAYVTLTVADSVDIYLDNQWLHRGSWKGTLEYGDYTFETRQEHFRSMYTPITISELDVTHSFILTNPVPAFGSLVVDGSPSDCAIYIDEQLEGETPLIINHISIGKHNIRVMKDGYKSSIAEVFIKENNEETLMYNLEVGSDIIEIDTISKVDIVQASIEHETILAEIDSSVLINEESGDTLQMLVNKYDALDLNSLEWIENDLMPETSKSLITNTMILGEMGYSIAPQVAYGIMIGQIYNGMGWYIKGRSNFNFLKATNGRSCDEKGRLNDSNVIPFYSGRKFSTEWLFDLGMAVDLMQIIKNKKRFKNNSFGIYLGCGYGEREVFWETKAGNLVTYTPNSYSGLSMDGGLFGSVYSVTISAGVNTIGFKYLEFEAGIGVTF